MAEVFPINQGKKKGKIPINEVYSQIANTIMGNQAANRQGFEQNFQVYEPSPGVREIVSLAEDGVVTALNPEAVVAEIMAYGQMMKNVLPEYCLSHAQSAEAMKVWRGLAKPIPRPETMRWLSERGACWRRIPFDLIQGESPTWDRLLGKIADEDARTAVKAWIGSLFVPGSYRQQYVWIYGGGGNGKGCIARFLQRIFGAAAHFLSHIPKEPNQFFTSQLLNRRLVIIPDCENYSFPASGLFKTLSGGDPINIEKKGRDPYTELLDIMFFFTSNQLPNVSSERSDMRRAIFARMEDGGEWAPDFEEKLWAEGGAFLDHCIGLYAQMAPGRGPIKAMNTDLKEWVSTLEEPYEEVFREWFTLDDGGFIKPADMQKSIRGLFEKRWQQLAFLSWLERSHGVRKKSAWGERGPHCYPGIAFKRAQPVPTRMVREPGD